MMTGGTWTHVPLGLSLFKQCNFRLLSYMLSVYRLCSLSVMQVYCDKTTKVKIMRFLSKNILVLQLLLGTLDDNI